MLTRRLLTVEDVDEVLAFMQTDALYNDLCYDRPITRQDALEDITERPPGTNATQKQFYGYYQNNQLVALLDYITGYPEENCCFIGLLHVLPSCHRQGIGQTIVTGLYEESRNNGYQKLQLAVLGNNTAGLFFWKTMGFIELEIRNTMVAHQPKKVYLMEKLLADEFSQKTIEE